MNMDIIEEYWSDIDNRLKNLIENGYVKLPSLKIFELESIAASISDEMGSLTFKELGKNHKTFLDNLKIDKYLLPKLLEIAKTNFSFKGNLSNQYHVARKVEPVIQKKCSELTLIPIFLQWLCH